MLVDSGNLGKKKMFKLIKKMLDRKAKISDNTQTVKTSKGGQKMSQSSYSDEMVSALHKIAEGNDGKISYQMAADFADANGLKLRSVIAKVISEKIEYERKPERVTKRGEPVVRKAEIVSAIEAALEVAVPSLTKVSKTDLQTLAEAVNAEVPEGV